MRRVASTALRSVFWVVLVTLVAAAYSASVWGEFQWDDHRFVLDPETVDLERFIQLRSWITSVAAGNRPLTRLTFALNWIAGGTSPIAYHCVNVCLHLLATVLAFVLARDSLRRVGATNAAQAAALASALFALHPLQTQAVSYISQRAEVLSSVLYLSALVLLVRSDDAPNGRRRWGLRGAALAAFVLALASKQTAATLPAAWLLHAAFFAVPAERGTSPLGRVGRRLPAAAAFLALSVAASLGGLLATRGSHEAGFAIGWLDGRSYVLTQLRVVPTYLRLLFWPSGQAVDWTFPASRGWLEPPTTLLGGVILVALGAMSVVVERRTRDAAGGVAAAARVASFGFQWFLLVLAPSSLVPLANVIDEHRPYLACWGIFAGVAALATAAMQRSRRASVIGLAAAAAVVVALAAATWDRNRVWETELALWTDAARKSPGKSRVHANLGYALRRAGRHVEALQEFESAFRLIGDHAVPIETLMRNAAASMMALGRPAQAAKLLEGVVASGDAEPDTALALALAYLDAGRIAESEALVRGVLARTPGLAWAHDVLGEILVARGEVLAARDAFTTAVRLAPWDAESLLHLADSELRLGRGAEACRWFGAAARAPAAKSTTRDVALSRISGLDCSGR